jgi:tetratricopeptide (TPR) repeat protein
MERIGMALTQLGLWDEAIDFYSRCLERPEGRGRVWVACGSALVRRERWREVRELASRMRSHPGDAASWVGYSRYLDGVALLGLGHTNEAIGEFRRLLETPHCDARAALAVGTDLVQRRFPEVATGLLHRREPEFAGFPEFWRILVRAAVQQGDAELMLTAARREYALDAQGIEAANDLAVALLLNGQEPGLARQLTRRVLDADPESASAMIHHSLALLGDRLPRAARPLLESIDGANLPAAQRNSLAFARALLAADDNRLTDLASQLRELHPAWLFPDQQAQAEALWLRVAAGPVMRP